MAPFMSQPVTLQEGYEIGYMGAAEGGKCCGLWCLDCDYVRRHLPEFKAEYDEKYAHLPDRKISCRDSLKGFPNQ